MAEGVPESLRCQRRVPGPSHCVIDNFWGINLNINGKRFQNENTNFAFGARSLLTQPQTTGFGIWDTAYAQTQEEWETLGCSVNNVTPQKPLTPEQMVAMWDANVEKGTYFKADTLEELLDQLEGIDKKRPLLPSSATIPMRNRVTTKSTR